MSQAEQTQPADRSYDCDDVIYLLGFTPTATEPVRSSILETLPYLECLSSDGIDAWYVSVARDQFEGEDAEKNLADLAWLTPRIMAHQRSLELLAEQLTLYPATFGTLFSSHDVLQSTLARNHETLDEYFAAVAGKQEWGIKCLVSWPDAVEAYQRVHPDTSQSTKGGGVNYLRRQKLIRDRDERVRSWIDEELKAIESDLTARSSALCHRRITDRSIKKETECLANIAVLLKHESVESTLTWSQEWEEQRNARKRLIKIELTGPWPSFSFCPPMVDDARAEQPSCAI